MMKKEKNNNSFNRRDFIKIITTTALSGTVVLKSACAETKGTTQTVEAIHLNEQPTMTYRKLGRTGFVSSRLVFGCGAALTHGRASRLLERAFEAGINHFDVGSDIYYKGSERNLAKFLKTHRDQVWVVSKAPALAYTKTDDSISLEQAKSAAKYWTGLMDASLKDLDTDYMDAYYLMAVNSPSLVRSEEIYNAFLKAKAAGKVGYFGLSSHKNAQNVLEAAIETGWYDLAMIGITPAGWYDWSTKSLAEDTSTLFELQGLLNRASEAGIGLIGMKTVRYLAPFWSLGKGDPHAFDHVYSEVLKSSSFNSFQRAYAFVLQHGLDVVNADMQNFKHLEENIIAAATAHQYFG